MSSFPTRKLRYAVIGVGASVLGNHLPALRSEGVELAGACDANVELGGRRAEELGCEFYADYRPMLEEIRPEVVIVLTPHPSHASITTDCLWGGSHVLVEKPMAAHMKEADGMIRAAEAVGRLLAVNFQHRHRPEVRAAKKIIERGDLGEIQHANLTVAWPRTAAYYESSGWRGTWAGEGGGVLINQAPHGLDLLCHLLGSPRRVVAWTRTLLHRIETEDTVQAMLEWPNGALGSVSISTASFARQERLEILGTGGRMELGSDRLMLESSDEDLREYVVRSHDAFGAPSVKPVAVDLEPGAGDHVAVHRNLRAAILEGTPLLCDGREGRQSLEIANAMTYSSHTKTGVELSLDPESYATLLRSLIDREQKVRDEKVWRIDVDS